MSNEFEQLEREIDQQIKFLDEFHHPEMSGSAIDGLYSSLTNTLWKMRVFRFVRRVSTIAAGVVIVFSLWIYLAKYDQTDRVDYTAQIYALAESNIDSEIDAIYDELTNISNLLPDTGVVDQLDILKDKLDSIDWEFNDG